MLRLIASCYRITISLWTEVRSLVFDVDGVPDTDITQRIGGQADPHHRLGSVP